jgi:hypothetical protein
VAVDTPKTVTRRALDTLDDAALTDTVHGLGPEGLTALVADVGLADAGHWLALATPAQVLEVLDDAVWDAPPGQVERFDPARFVTWLEALVEVGAAVAADRLAEVPIELAVVGLYRQALVFDTDELWLAVARGLVDDVVHLYAQLELEEHLLLGRGHDGWDAVVATMTELADRHPTFCAALLDRCRDLTDHAVGEAGLAAALEDEDEGEEEASLEREDRRAARGFVAPHAARSFLALAVEVELDAQRAFVGRDPVTAAYFRDWERERPAPAPGVTRGGVEGARPEELGYLVQVVVAACERGGRRFTVEEAAEAVLAVCRVGESVARAHRRGGRVVPLRVPRVAPPRRGPGADRRRPQRPRRADPAPRRPLRRLRRVPGPRRGPAALGPCPRRGRRGREGPGEGVAVGRRHPCAGRVGAPRERRHRGPRADRGRGRAVDDGPVGRRPLGRRAPARVLPGAGVDAVAARHAPARARPAGAAARPRRRVCRWTRVANAAWHALSAERQRSFVEHVAGVSGAAARRRAAFVVGRIRGG